ncbi:hypothetical protein KBX37_23415 [Micromonospora sp. U56]|uniref:hypothetical protein n=1 Tax=Micromonospora sp. U56 TaxID=2824900 RepID=UPI001B37B14F|nr:hypothetical protein [Micromonospora sp. U56]MBQ0896008.1 hypothetical protein [Micromonospora sp. U56]
MVGDSTAGPYGAEADMVVNVHFGSFPRPLAGHDATLAPPPTHQLGTTPPAITHSDEPMPLVIALDRIPGKTTTVNNTTSGASVHTGQSPSPALTGQRNRPRAPDDQNRYAVPQARSGAPPRAATGRDAT